MPASTCPPPLFAACCRGGAGIEIPSRAHRSIPIRTGLSREGRMLNVCRRVLPWIVTGNKTRPGIVALLPSARLISPSPGRGWILIPCARLAISAFIMEISDPVSSKADTWRPNKRIVTWGRGVNFTRIRCWAGIRLLRPRPCWRFPAVGGILVCGPRLSRIVSKIFGPGGGN